MNDEHLMIDGYNVIFRTSSLRDQARTDLERAREELVRRVRAAFTGRRQRVTVVFDGNRETTTGRTTGGGVVRVVFSSPPETADQRIQRLIEDARRLSGGKHLTVRVVSSDREVAGRARLWGASAVSVEAFLREVEERPARKRGPDHRGEEIKPGPGGGIAEWERFFLERRGDAEDPDREPLR